MQCERSRVVGQTVVRAIVLVAALSSPAGRAYADAAGGPSDSKPSPLKYSAFDLARGRIPITKLVGTELGYPGFVTMAGALLDCATPQVVLRSSGGAHVRWLIVSADPSTSCAIFAAREPGTIKVRATPPVAGVTSELTVDFDKGSPFAGSSWFDGKNLHLRSQVPVGEASEACFAYYSPRDGRWQAVTHDVPWNSSDPRVKLPLSELSGTVYAHHGPCADGDAERAALDVMRVDYQPVVMHDLGDFNDCDDQLPDEESKQRKKKHEDEYEKRYGAKANYIICIDQANALGVARITRNHGHYIQTFSFGRIVIRHWRTVVPVVTIVGAGVSINQPGFAGPGIVVAPGPTSGAPTAALVTGGFALPVTADGQGMSSETSGEYVVSTVFIPPHAPGAMHIDIKFVDPGDAKPRAATAIDVAVDQGYSGSLRLGIAHVFGAQDHRYSKLQLAPSLPAEIAQSDTGANEVVVGYSLYLDALFPGHPSGRSYAVFEGNWFWRHAGLFVGFGAVSYSPGNIDFLKSIHLGVELELTRNLSIAGTVVGRRVTQLDGNLHVGGLAPPGDLPTSTAYRYGLGFVLNFSTDFVKFATAAPTAGASK